MEKKYTPLEIEKRLSTFWEKKGFFHASVDREKQPFSIILPPPNANGAMHLGHAMFVYEDIMIRYQKMQGKQVFWLLGLDHAGIETQFVFEKHLKKQGKSRFDYDRDTLYQMIWDFVMQNKHVIHGQMRQLGFSLDWTKEKFTLDENVVAVVYQTFQDLFDRQLVYRAHRLVNYCTHCGTSFSDIEVADKENEGLLYYLKYPLKTGGFITVATTRPETLYGDVAVMVHPQDKRYLHLIGERVILPLIHKEIPIIANEHVDRKFGTGAVKATPAHDFEDFAVAQTHKLSYPVIIGFDGKMQNTGVVDGLRVNAAREETLKKLDALHLVDKIQPHKLVIKVCYRCGRTLEPLPKEQWYIKIRPLADQAKRLITAGQISVYPKRFTKQLIRIFDDFIDWNISRQVVWGIRIPAYFCASQKKWFVSQKPPSKCQICAGQDAKQDEDTFDTWFSSAQWPFATLQTISPEFYQYYYPTSVMETGYEILRPWVARMIMIGYFSTKQVPFRKVFLHGMVRDKQGVKMSKSKGNVIDPLKMVALYGADALRAALIFGTKEGNDTVLPEDKIVGMRNFANKIWNIGRYIKSSQKSKIKSQKLDSTNLKILQQLQKEQKQLEKKYHTEMGKYHFAKALELIYQFLWHQLADYYIEQLKEAIRSGKIEALSALKKAYLENLKMLHPYMPFVTEAVWQVFHGEDKSIIENSIS